MATYIYETIPDSPNEKPERFEVTQSMLEAPLKKHPVSGKPVRRVLVGGFAPIGTTKMSGGFGGGGSCSHNGGGCGCG